MSNDWSNGHNKGFDIAEKLLEELNAYAMAYAGNKDYISGLISGVYATIGANLVEVDGEIFCGLTEDV